MATIEPPAEAGECPPPRPAAAPSTPARAGGRGPTIARVHRFLFDDWQGAALCTALVLGLALFCGFQGTFLNDEALVPYAEARGLRHEFWAFFFVHKFKPFNLVLYILPSTYGYHGYILAHAVISAATLPLMAAAARALRIPHPNMAAWALGTSYAFLVSCASGFANTNAAAFLALYLLLRFSGHTRWAALVLGVLPLIRYESAALVVLFSVEALVVERDRRAVVLVLVAPLAYYVGGAIYLHDPLWAIQTTVDPSLTPQPLHVGQLHRWTPVQMLTYLGSGFATNAPLLLLFAPLGFERRDRRSVSLFVVCVSYYSLHLVIQYVTCMFALDVRHYVAGLPLAALVVARALAPSETLVRGAARLVRSARLREAVGRRADHVRLGLLAISAIIATVLLLDPGASERQQRRALTQVINRLVDADLIRDRAIYTDFWPLFYDPGIRAAERRLLVNYSITWELQHSTKPAQLALVRRGFERSGWLFEPHDLVLRGDAIYVIRPEGRNAEWMRRLEEQGAKVVQVGAFNVYFQIPVRR